MATITINDSLLEDYSGREKSGFQPTYQQDENGDNIELTEEELTAQKIAYAKARLLEEVLAKFIRPAEIEIRQAKLAEAETAVESVKTSAAAGITVE